MKNIDKTFLLSLIPFLILLLSGCATATAAPSPTPTDTQTSTATSTSTETRTPSSSPSPTETATSTPRTIVKYSDLQIETDWEKRNLEGRIVLEGLSCWDMANVISYPVQNSSYIWDLDTNLKYEFEIRIDQEIENFAISPDLSKLALWIGSNKYDTFYSKLRIVDNNGDKLSESFHPFSEWMYMIDWYDNQSLMFDENYYSEDLSYNPPSTIEVYDPFSQKSLTTILGSIYPNSQHITGGAIYWGKYYYSEAVISPDHQYAAYFLNNGYLGLWDIPKSKALMELNPGEAEYGPPVWSSNSNFLILEMYPDPSLSDDCQVEELYKADIRNGLIRLSYLGDTLTKVDIRYYDLSPDGNKVVLNLRIDQTDLEFLIAVLDIEKNKVTIFKNLVSFRYLYPIPYRSPVWSPDGNQIMALVNKEEGEGYRTVLIDLNENFIVELAEDVKPVGWMMDE